MNEARPVGAAETINLSSGVEQWPFRAASEGEFAGLWPVDGLYADTTLAAA